MDEGNRVKIQKIESTASPLKLHKPKSNFFEMACALSVVCDFVKAVCRYILPFDIIWGTKHNKNVFMSNIDKFIKAGRFELIKCSDLCTKIHTSKIPWLKQCSSPQKVLESFMRWLFTDVIKSLLHTTFYITEGEGLGTEVLYYEKSDWLVIRRLGEKQMCSHFAKVF